MTTEGTALQGLLQQEREALERENAAAAENGSVNPNNEGEAALNGNPVKVTAEDGGVAALEGAQATDDQAVCDAVKL